MTSSPYEDATGRRSVLSLDAQGSTRPSSSRQLGSNVILVDDDNGGVRDEVRGQDSEQFLEVTQLCAKLIT